MSLNYLLRQFLTVILFYACARPPSVLSKTELQQYIADPGNGLVQQQELNGIKIAVSYQPGSLLAAGELGNHNYTDSALISTLEKKYNGNIYFFLRLSKNGKEAIRELGDFASYSSMVSTLSFRMDRFINLTTDTRDTIPLADFAVDQTYGLNNANTILLGFNREQLVNNSRLQVNISEFGMGTGNMTFVFDKKSLQNTPYLDYRSLF